MAASAAASASPFPYLATLTAETAYYAEAAIAGPAAGQLPAGSVIEVHQQNGDWLAIRPPADSYSWVSQRDVQPTTRPGILSVKPEGAICWVGHAGSQRRTASQVQLHAGEMLQLKGQWLLGTESGIQRWLMVAPPAGEFRFVHVRHIRQVAPQPVAVATAADVNWSSRTSAGENGAVTAGPTMVPSVVQVPASPQSEMPGRSVTSVQKNTSDQVSACPQSSALFQNAALTSQTTLPVLPEAARMSPVAAHAVELRLTQIDRYLTAMVAQSPTTWDTAALGAELQALTATAPTPALRVKSHSLWSRIVKCQEIQQGYSQLAANFQTSVHPSSGNAAAVGTAATGDSMAQTTRLATVQPAVYNPAGPVAGGYYSATTSPYAQGPLNISPEFRALTPASLMARVRKAAVTLKAAVEPGGDLAEYGRIPQVQQQSLPAAALPEMAIAEVDENGHSGSGWLMPLVGRSQLPRDSRSGIPPFALTDDEGNVLFLVTPASGMSLREYVRKEVGIVGPVSRLPSLENPHITAQRVIVLERHE